MYQRTGTTRRYPEVTVTHQEAGYRGRHWLVTCRKGAHWTSVETSWHSTKAEAEESARTMTTTRELREDWLDRKDKGGPQAAHVRLTIWSQSDTGFQYYCVADNVSGYWTRGHIVDSWSEALALAVDQGNRKGVDVFADCDAGGWALAEPVKVVVKIDGDTGVISFE